MPYSLAERDGRYCVVTDDGQPVAAGCHDEKRDAVAHLQALQANVPEARRARTASLADQFPLDPPEEWFTELPSWFQPNMKLSVCTEGPEAGRVAGTVAPKGVFLLNGTGDPWKPPPSPTGYREAMQGDTYTASGSVIPTANLSCDIDHVSPTASFRQARDAMANTGTALARVRYVDTDYGTVALGAAWPGLSDLQVRKMQASALSGHWCWREELGEYDMAGSIFVNNPGLPLPNRPVFRPLALVASVGDPHPAIIGSWVCDEEGCVAMPPEPTVTLTLSATETARLHELLTAPKVAAAGACTCQGHTAAALPGEVPPEAEPGGDVAALTERVAALEERISAMEQEKMDGELADLDARAASVALPALASV